MKAIKQRIKSVESTKQITKAMELVASSKLRRAKERVETARPYFNTLLAAIHEMAMGNHDTSSLYTQKRSGKKAAFIIIAGDRGLAGGYNANILKFAGALMQGKEASVVPVGKKVVEYFESRHYPLVKTPFATVEEMDLEAAFELGALVCDLYCSGQFDEVHLVYTEFVSMLSQVPAGHKVLPLQFDASPSDNVAPKIPRDTTFEPEIVEVLDRIVPQYVGGMIYGAISESYASEQGARRTAMEAATDNAEEMIAGLSLRFNRARQGSITQEITEIVAGANALS